MLSPEAPIPNSGASAPSVTEAIRVLPLVPMDSTTPVILSKNDAGFLQAFRDAFFRQSELATVFSEGFSGQARMKALPLSHARA